MLIISPGHLVPSTLCSRCRNRTTTSHQLLLTTSKGVCLATPAACLVAAEAVVIGVVSASSEGRPVVPAGGVPGCPRLVVIEANVIDAVALPPSSVL